MFSKAENLLPSTYTKLLALIVKVERACAVAETETPDMAMGKFTGKSNCEAKYPSPHLIVPYGNQSNEIIALFSSRGYKEITGWLTEGRYLTFESSEKALTNSGNGLIENNNRIAHLADFRQTSEFVIIDPLRCIL
ncbi:non-hemolytic phospholipase C precursor [Penicillium sp. IBT 18751x]|nr:non-hemolytic phospholipase C precursor [Penicillium sp. IBT 18751x]KAJ6117829.1 non-hemolytic phospholipase C precursor [Penicillium sp. IBT 18751x]